ncbi:MAG: Iron(II)-dependent oxidoreductase EgtB [Pseudomonadota bacterium]
MTFASHALAAGAVAARTGDAHALGQALQGVRARTQGLMAAWARSMPELTVPYAPELNPPLWELGHIGWFQDWWIARNRERPLGHQCAPAHARAVSRLSEADSWYNSSQVPHASRWHLRLPDLAQTWDYVQAVQADTLALLAGAGEDDDGLYFWRLVLLHEAMHNEASVYMAQALGVAMPDALAQRCSHSATPAAVLHVPAQTWLLGATGPGFAFDNELGPHPVTMAAFEIDACPVSWARYLPFIDATGRALPPHVRCLDGQWQQQRFGHWGALVWDGPAVHLNVDDAEDWCYWAGRRLPTEAEWECAALTQNGFAWGQVWEWTASAFEAYPGFAAHPYEDYSAPWFGARRVLRGACAATDVTMVHPRYRNFFTPERRDIFAGFRSAM